MAVSRTLGKHEKKYIHIPWAIIPTLIIGGTCLSATILFAVTQVKIGQMIPNFQVASGGWGFLYSIFTSILTATGIILSATAAIKVYDEVA